MFSMTGPGRLDCATVSTVPPSTSRRGRRANETDFPEQIVDIYLVIGPRVIELFINSCPGF